MHEDTSTIWHGMDSLRAVEGTGASHVGGLSAAINWGWTTAVEHMVSVYGARDGIDDTTIADVRVRCVRPGVRLAPCIGLSMRRDGSGARFATSDRDRAVVECLVDDDLLDVDEWREIVRGALHDGLDAEAILSHARAHGPEVADLVARRLSAVEG